MKTAHAEKIDSTEYDKFWLQSFMERMKHEDNVELGQILMKAPKDKALNELKSYVEKFEKTHEQRTKDLYKKDKEMAKVFFLYLK